jgi:hypothetical protein
MFNFNNFDNKVILLLGLLAGFMIANISFDFLTILLSIGILLWLTLAIVELFIYIENYYNENSLKLLSVDYSKAIISS